MTSTKIRKSFSFSQLRIVFCAVGGDPCCLFVMRKYCFLFIVFFLTSCGGGSGSSSVPATAPRVTTDSAPPFEVARIDAIDPSEVHSGGQASVSQFDTNAFSEQAPLLGFEGDANFKAGNLLFRGVQPGLGPIFNTNSCQSCHIKDGRGALPRNISEPLQAIVLKITSASLGDDPVNGSQLQTFGIDGPAQAGGQGALAEAFALIEYEIVNGSYPDGTPYRLRRPVYKIRDFSYGEPVDDVVFSPRMANAVFGLGLLEAIPDEDIERLADPDDANEDGISGRVSRVTDVLTGETRIGRFTHKAQSHSILQQLSNAYQVDMGITNSLFSEEPCTVTQEDCLSRADQEANSGPGGVDISDLELALVEFYVRHLAVPRRRGYENGQFSAGVQAGRRLFFEANCTACHTPRQRTGGAPESVLGRVVLNSLEPSEGTLPAISNQVIWPYTDLLLHDMGGSCEPARKETEDGAPCTTNCFRVQRCSGLADGRAEGSAGPSEWRTPPLWGLGLTKTVLPEATFLHDGRARTIEEAILWHGGEAEEPKQFFMNMSRREREQLLAFLESL